MIERIGRTDIAVFVVGNDGIREALVDSDILFIRRRFIEGFRLGCIRNDIMQTRPQYLRF